MNGIERGKARDFSYVFEQEFKENRRLKKMDIPVSESKYCCCHNREIMEMVNGFHSGREGKMVERRDNGLDRSLPIFFHWESIWQSQCSIQSSWPQTMKYSHLTYKLEMILQNTSSL